jgi:hypothetical protein
MPNTDADKSATADNNYDPWNPTGEEVIRHYEYIMGRFQKAVKYFDGNWAGRGMPFGVCSHLWDVQDALSRPVPRVYSGPGYFGTGKLHMWSNAPGVVICLWCAQRFRRHEVYSCGTCGLPNPYRDGHYRAKERVCDVHNFAEPPLLLHLPLCRSCERVITRHRASREAVSVT